MTTHHHLDAIAADNADEVDLNKTNTSAGAGPAARLLGEWRTQLEEEQGVDGGGLRREIAQLFFDQLHTTPWMVEPLI